MRVERNMEEEHCLFKAAADAAQLSRGTVLTVDENVLVVLQGTSSDIIVCDVLHSSEQSLRFSEGDSVLILVPGGEGEHGVVLGRIGPARALISSEVSDLIEGESESSSGLPETLVLEAKKSLTLRVGDGSITIRADGKILIKGKDLVSHAQRTNRIKGGSVSIN